MNRELCHRVTSFLAAIACATFVSACAQGGNSITDESSSLSQDASASDSVSSSESSDDEASLTLETESTDSFEPVTVADDDRFVIRVEDTASDPGYIDNFGYVLYLENKTDSKVTFTYEDGSFSVDGAMITPKFMHDVMPGKVEKRGYLVFIADEGVGGFDELKDVEGVIEVRDADSYELIASYDMAIK